MNATSIVSTDGRTQRPTSWRTYLSHASSGLSCVILLGGALTIALAAYMVVVSYSSLPFADGWAPIAAAAGGMKLLSFDWLAHQHNEHRPVIPKLLLITDLRFFQYRQVFLLAAIFVIRLLHLLLLGWSMRALGGWRGAVWRTGLGLAAFCLFCLAQWENFVWGFQVCFVLPGLFATLSFIGLLLYWIKSESQPGRGHGWMFLLLSILAACGATYSLANGNLLWPLLVAAAVFLRLRFAAVLSLVITGALSIALYFHHYVRTSAHSGPITAMAAPSKVVEYLAMYLGSSWVRQYNPAAVLVGMAGLGLSLLFTVRFRSFVQKSNAFSVQLALTFLFCLGTAVLTALGRVHLGIMQAYSSRYQSVALVFWWSLGLLLLLPIFNAKRGGLPFFLTQLCILAIMVRGADRARDSLREARSHGFELNTAAISLLTGVHDPAQLRYAYPDADFILRLEPYLREGGLSIFSDAISGPLGKPLDTMFRLASPEECIGVLQSATPVPGPGSKALRVSGWAWDRKGHGHPVEIVATTNGIVTGLAGAGGWRPTIRAANPWLKSSYVGFVGYIPEVNASAPVKFYAILRGSPPAACYFATN